MSTATKEVHERLLLAPKLLVDEEGFRAAAPDGIHLFAPDLFPDVRVNPPIRAGPGVVPFDLSEGSVSGQGIMDALPVDAGPIIHVLKLSAERVGEPGQLGARITGFDPVFLNAGEGPCA